MFDFSINTLKLSKPKAAPKTRLVALWPSGHRCIVTHKGHSWHYGNGCSAGPLLRHAECSASGQGVTFIREPIQQGA